MPDLISKQYHHVSPTFLLNSLGKARIAQDQLWEASQPLQRLALRQLESLSSVLLAWLAVEGTRTSLSAA